MRNYKAWLKGAIIFQFLFAIVHVPTLFITPAPNNESEKQLYQLMSTYSFDFGAGFHRTMDELSFVFSASLALLLLFGGLMNAFLLRKNASSEIMKGVLHINLIVFGICFGIILKFAFLFPIILSGLIFLLLLLSRLTFAGSREPGV